MGDALDQFKQLLCGAACGVCVRGGHPLFWQVSPTREYGAAFEQDHATGTTLHATSERGREMAGAGTGPLYCVLTQSVSQLDANNPALAASRPLTACKLVQMVTIHLIHACCTVHATEA